VKAVLCRAFGPPSSLTVEDIAEPVPGPGEALVRVRAAGLNFYDTLAIRDKYQYKPALPFSPGGELAGEVEAVGPEATGVAIGQRRVVFPWIGCGQCDSCRAGEEQICVKPQQMGIQVDGGYATHLLVPDARYLIDYAGIAAERAGSLMCSGLTAYAALRRLGSLAERGPVLIMGLGGVGMMGFAFAKAMFAHAPVVADISAAKREAALAAGAASAWDPSDPEARRAFLKATGGVFGAVDFVGAEVSFNFAQAALKKGGKLVVAGLFGGSFSMPIPFLPMRAIAIEGSYVGTLAEAEAMIDEAHQLGLRVAPPVFDLTPAPGPALASIPTVAAETPAPAAETTTAATQSEKKAGEA